MTCFGLNLSFHNDEHFEGYNSQIVNHLYQNINCVLDLLDALKSQLVVHMSSGFQNHKLESASKLRKVCLW